MTEVLLDKPEKQAQANRQIVSYFDQEFMDLTPEKATEDINEIVAAGYTTVVLCITERDLASPERLRRLCDLVTEMKERGLEVWADPWNLCGMFGGEAISYFEEAKEKRCMCNPKARKLIDYWTEIIPGLGINVIFLDEPEMKCDDHRFQEIQFLEKVTAKAGTIGLESVVCLCADYRRQWHLKEVAAMPDVVELAADPYPYPHPYVFDKGVPKADRLDFITEWTIDTRRAAEAAGKRSHIWQPTFGITRGHEFEIVENLLTVRQHIGSSAVWGFRGCMSVPNFDAVTPRTLDPLVAWNTTNYAYAVINNRADLELAA